MQINLRKVVAVCACLAMLCMVLPMSALAVFAEETPVIDVDFNDGANPFGGGSVVAEGPDGSNCLKWTAAGGWSTIKMDVTGVNKNTTFVITFKAKASVSDTMGITIQNAGWGSYYTEHFTTQTEWTEYSIETNVGDHPTNSGGIMFKFQDQNTTMDLWVDDLVMVEKESDTPEEPDAPAGDNLILNGDLETGTLANWETWQDTAVSGEAAYEGAYGLIAKGNGGWGGVLRQRFAVQPNSEYVIRFAVKAVSQGFNIKVTDDNAIANGDNNARLWGMYYSTSNGTGWREYEYYFSSGNNTTSSFQMVGSGLNQGDNPSGIGDEVWIDNIVIERVAGDPILNENISGGQHSVSEDVSGLAFRFAVTADNAAVEKGNVYVYGSANIKPYKDSDETYKVIRAGAIVTNDSTIGKDEKVLNADNVDGKKTIDVAAKYLCDLENDSFAYAVRIINIPEANRDTDIFVRPYYVYEDAEGNEQIVYGNVKSENYNHGSLPEEVVVQQQVEELLSTKHKLTYNEDGSFRVLIIADAHMDTDGDATDVQEVKDRIKYLVDKEDPNLVIFTGDNTINSWSENDLRTNIDAIVGYVEEKQIPWCHVYGNHDEEMGISKSRQQAVYESYAYCVSKTGPEDIFGVGNYVLGVYNTDGSLGSVIYCLDSGAYATEGGYDYIKEDQIAWYKETSELLQKYNGGQAVEGMMAFHIPLYENRLAYNNRNDSTIVTEWNGERNENICSSDRDVTSMFETMLERGDIKAVVTGHDHINDYMFNYYGIKLCSSPNVSDLTYNSARVQGGRVFDLNLSTLDNIPTYVTYIIDRSAPEDAGVLAPNVALEMTKETIDSTTITGYNSASLSGAATIAQKDGVGVNGSAGIELTRGSKANTEIVLTISNQGKLGENKYLMLWADFTNVDFRKACFGLQTPEGNYRTDDADYNTPFYYLADGATEWVAMSHAWDGCFGTEQSSSVIGKKGYFAFPVEYFLKGSTALTSESVITGVYFYFAITNDDAYFNKPFYLDDFQLVTSYTSADDYLGENVALEFPQEAIENVVFTSWNGGSLVGDATMTLKDGVGVNGGSALELTRSNNDKTEFILDITKAGKLGENKYLVVWADFTNVEMFKACFGFQTTEGVFRTDDADYNTPFYYLADGSGEWMKMTHGWDGCFGNDQGSSVIGKKGYFAFPVENFLNGSKTLTPESSITGLYCFYRLAKDSSYYNQPFYLADFRLVENYEDLF